MTDMLWHLWHLLKGNKRLFYETFTTGRKYIHTLIFQQFNSSSNGNLEYNLLPHYLYLNTADMLLIQCISRFLPESTSMPLTRLMKFFQCIIQQTVLCHMNPLGGPRGNVSNFMKISYLMNMWQCPAVPQEVYIRYSFITFLCSFTVDLCEVLFTFHELINFVLYQCGKEIVSNNLSNRS